MMYSNIKQITFKEATRGHFLHVAWIFQIFREKFGLGLSDDVIALTL